MREETINTTASREQIEGLRHMTVGQLKEKYHEVFGEDSRSNHKQFLFQRGDGRIQANAKDGLSATKKQLLILLVCRTPRRYTVLADRERTHRGGTHPWQTKSPILSTSRTRSSFWRSTSWIPRSRSCPARLRRRCKARRCRRPSRKRCSTSPIATPVPVAPPYRPPTVGNCWRRWVRASVMQPPPTSSSRSRKRPNTKSC